jgi:hypothetical protein
MRAMSDKPRTAFRTRLEKRGNLGSASGAKHGQIISGISRGKTQMKNFFAAMQFRNCPETLTLGLVLAP